MAATTEDFAPPGPGLWTRDPGHFPRPVTRATAELFPEPAIEGFTAGTRPYGLLLSHVEWRFVHGWGYLCARPVAPLARAERLTRTAWDDLVATHPELSERVATATTVFERRPWREELAGWEQDVRPSTIEAHRHLQAQDPARMATEDLAAHVEACRSALRRAIRRHHRFDVTPVMAVGDFLVQAGNWTGASPVELLAPVLATDRIAVAGAGAMTDVVDAIRADPAAAQALGGPDPAAVLAWLRSRPGPVGEAVPAYLDLVGHWASGSGIDIDEPALLEMPDVLVELVRTAVEGHDGAAADADGDPAAALRDAVPAAHRPAFDDLLAEARLVHGLRHERATFTDMWANGLLRRAVLAAGERLGAAGRVEQPAHLLEAGAAELDSLVQGRGGPSASELAERARARHEARGSAVPEVLGGPHRSPVPVDWLPSGAARTERAFRTYLAAMSAATEPGDDDGRDLHGVGASAGVHEGRARLVRDPAELERVRSGDVLVAEALTPAVSLVLPLVGAIVTEGGGILSHGAIVAREHRIPAVVGARGALRRIPDGRTVRVDGRAGVVTLPAGP